MNTLKIKTDDIEFAEENHIHHENGTCCVITGFRASELFNCPEFEVTKFPFQVWDIGYRAPSFDVPCAMLLANQTTLEGALKHMKHERIMVYNRDADLESVNALKLNMCKTKNEKVAMEIAATRNQSYGHSVFDGFFYTGSKEQLEAIGVIII